jgi:hypothetical protein
MGLKSTKIDYTDRLQQKIDELRSDLATARSQNDWTAVEVIQRDISWMEHSLDQLLDEAVNSQGEADA